MMVVMSSFRLHRRLHVLGECLECGFCRGGIAGFQGRLQGGQIPAEGAVVLEKLAQRISSGRALQVTLKTSQGAGGGREIAGLNRRANALEIFEKLAKPIAAGGCRRARGRADAGNIHYFVVVESNTASYFTSSAEV